MNSIIMNLLGMILTLLVADIIAWVQCFRAQQQSWKILSVYKEAKDQADQYYLRWRAASHEALDRKLELEKCQAQNRALRKELYRMQSKTLLKGESSS